MKPVLICVAAVGLTCGVIFLLAWAANARSAEKVAGGKP